jgi:hypothetical protein
MKQKSIAEAIKTLTEHIMRHSSFISPEDIIPGRQPPDQDTAPRKAAVQVICDKMNDLGDRADSRYSEFDSLLTEARQYYADVVPKQVDDISDAFIAAGRI